MAAKYRKIETRIWNDQKFRALSDRGKLVFLMILTHPHMTSLGAMRATIAGMAAELGWPEKAFREAFGEGFRKALFKHDEDACFVWLPNFLRYNRPESPNVVKSWSDSFELLPECPLKDQLSLHVKAFAEGFGKAFTEALPEAFRKALPNQEQEQEQEQEQDKREKQASACSKRNSATTIPPTVEMVAEYCLQRKNNIDAEVFVDHYERQGWRLANGRPMKNWQAAVRLWEKRDAGRKPASRVAADDDLANWVP